MFYCTIKAIFNQHYSSDITHTPAQDPPTQDRARASFRSMGRYRDRARNYILHIIILYVRGI